MRPYEKLRAFWISKGIDVPPGVDQSEIRFFEKTEGLSFNDSDFKDYLCNLNGMRPIAGHDTDDELFSFFPMGRFKTARSNFIDLPQSKQFRSDDLVLDRFYIFADYCIASWEYGINDAGNVTIFGVPEPGLVSWHVAESFAEFVDLYIARSPRIYFTDLTSASEWNLIYHS